MSRNQAVNLKFDNISRLSGEVTAALSGLDAPSAVEAYSRIQALETCAVSAATAQLAAVKVADEAAAENDVLHKHLRMLNTAAFNICAIRGIVAADYFGVVDRGDEEGLARRLEPEIRRVPNYGPPLADAYAHMLRDLTAADAASVKAEATLVSAQRELDAAILNLQGVVAQGRAVLASLGVKFTRKTKKKKVEAKGAQEPQPSLIPVAA